MANALSHQLADVGIVQRVVRDLPNLAVSHQGELPELVRAKQVTMVDIDSGHWPMMTRPIELARVLAAAASSRD